MTNALITRRSFIKYCGGIAAALGLGPTMVPSIVRALTADNRLPVVWLHFAECTGCSESFLRATDPGVADILLDVLNVTYHETIQAACGEKAEANRDAAVSKFDGQFICVVEGAIPTANNGVYGMVGGRTMLEIAQSVIPRAKHTICFGTCAAFGGLPAAAPNPTGAKGVVGCRPFAATADPPSATARPSIPAALSHTAAWKDTTAKVLEPTTTATGSYTTKSPSAFRWNTSASAAQSPGSGMPISLFTTPCGCRCSTPTAVMPSPTKI